MRKATRTVTIKMWMLNIIVSNSWQTKTKPNKNIHSDKGLFGRRKLHNNITAE